MNDHTIVALLATRGVEDFLQNALLGLAGAGINPRIVHVARPDSAGDAIDPVIRAAGAHVVSFSRFCDPSPDFTSEGYVEYGIPAFISINWAKVRYLRWLLQQYRQVVYADVDVAWLADPLWLPSGCWPALSAGVSDRSRPAVPASVLLGVCFADGHGRRATPPERTAGRA